MAEEVAVLPVPVDVARLPSSTDLFVEIYADDAGVWLVVWCVDVCDPNGILL